MNDAVSLIKMYLKIEGNTHATLAAALGYKTSNTINHWLKIGRIPPHKLKEVKRVCAKG